MSGRSLALAWLLTFSPALLAQAPPALVADVDALVKQFGIRDDTPGLALLVLQEDRPLLCRSWGLARLQDKTPIAAHTTFELASLTKPITASAILKLQDQGKLSVADDVRKFIPELPRYRPERPILIGDLLQHTSGLPDYMRFEPVPSRDPKFLGNEDFAGLFARRLEKFPLRFSPGKAHEYNNSNYMLLALVLERIAKKSFGEVLREEVFRPLGMEGTWVYEKPASTPRHPRLGYRNAIGYSPNPKKKDVPWRESWGSPPFRDEKLLTTGDGGVWTSVEDLARWDIALRNGKLIRPRTLQHALKPCQTDNGKTHPYGYGLALGLTARGEVRSFGHNGDWSGFRSCYQHNLASRRTIFLLSNRADLNIERLGSAIEGLLDKQ